MANLRIDPEVRYSKDASGNVTGLVGPDGGNFGGAVTTPSARTSAAIQSAINSLASIGGGTVVLEPATYACTEQIVLKSGVSIVGSLFVNTITSNVPEDSEVLLSGTILEGDGTFIGIAGNAEDQVSSTTAIAASGSTGARTSTNRFAENALQGIRIANISLKNFTYGIKVGAQNNYGLLRGILENVFTIDCSVWGMSFDNFQYCQFDRLLSKVKTNSTAGGIRFGAWVPSTTLVPGDSEISNLHVVTNYHNNRGLVFDVSDDYTNSLHNLHVYRAQVNRLDAIGSGLLFNSFTTAASSNIAVTNCEYFPVGMPVWFTDSAGSDFTFANNLNDQGAKQIYFIASRSVATGAGDVTIVSRQGGTPITLSGTTARRIYTGGYPNIEGLSKSGNSLLHCHLYGVAAEGQYNPAVSLQGFNGSKIELIDVQSNAVAGLVLRGASDSIAFLSSSSNKIKTDFDNGAAGVQVFGSKSTAAPVGPSGRGFFNGRMVTAADGTLAYGTNVSSAGAVNRWASNGCYVNITVAAGVTGAQLLARVTLASALTENYAILSPSITPADAATAAIMVSSQIYADYDTDNKTDVEIWCGAAVAAGNYAFFVRW